MFRRPIKQLVKTKKYFRNLSDKSNIEYDFRDQQFNSKFEYEYIKRMESQEKATRHGIFGIGFTIVFSGYLIGESIKTIPKFGGSIRNFYGFREIEKALWAISDPRLNNKFDEECK